MPQNVTTCCHTATVTILMTTVLVSNPDYPLSPPSSAQPNGSPLQAPPIPPSRLDDNSSPPITSNTAISRTTFLNPNFLFLPYFCIPCATARLLSPSPTFIVSLATSPVNPHSLSKNSCYTFFFYKNIQAEIPEKIRT